MAEKTFPDLPIFWFPFDFTWAVRRTLRCLQPSLVILAELELWPNFVRLSEREGVPILIVNGRLSEKSFRGYRRLTWIARPMFACVDFFAVQSEEHAQRLRALGVDAVKIEVTGSVKFDGVQGDREHPKVKQLGDLLGLASSVASVPEKLVWVVGSTQEPEERWAIEIYKDLRQEHARLTLVLVPRHQERFEVVARMLHESGITFVRRSQLSKASGNSSAPASVILVDTLGELSYVWGLADLAFVGGSFNNRGGQNMIEPAAYGVPVIFGPNVWNFQHIADALLRDNAALQVTSKQEWRKVTADLLSNAEKRDLMGRRAGEFVAKHQGATQKTIVIIEKCLIPNPVTNKQAA